MRTVGQGPPYEFERASGNGAASAVLRRLILLLLLLLVLMLLVEELVDVRVVRRALHLLDDVGRRRAVVDLVDPALTVGIAIEHVRIVDAFEQALGFDAARAERH